MTLEAGVCCSQYELLLPTQIAEEGAADICAPAVAEALSTQVFWGELDLLNALLEPLSAVIAAVQAGAATLADATRYWVYLGQELLKQMCELPIGARTTLLLVTWRPAYRDWSPTDTLARFPHPSVSTGFAQHIADAYSRRVAQMDNLTGRLALALDPRFKRVALPEGQPVKVLAVHVGKLLQLRGASPEVRALAAPPDLSKQVPLP